MLTSSVQLPRRANGNAGFSLVELMVAMVVGLIVTLAAVGFVASIARANSEDLQVTRLTQEMRAISEVVQREIRRARYVVDPIGNVTQAVSGPPPQDNDAIAIADAPNGVGSTDCITLSYDRPPTESAGTVARALYLDNGRIYVANALACSNGVAVSSPQIQVTELSFDNDTSTANAIGAVEGFVRMRVGGRFVSAVGSVADVTRTFQQDIYIRSGEVD